jgi:hypothetical protein
MVRDQEIGGSNPLSPIAPETVWLSPNGFFIAIELSGFDERCCMDAAKGAWRWIGATEHQ